jgi:hypothetical protein
LAPDIDYFVLDGFVSETIQVRLVAGSANINAQPQFTLGTSLTDVLWTLRGGRIAEGQEYGTREAALEAAESREPETRT